MFADDIKESLTEEAYNVFSRTGIGSYDEMYALLVQFPSINGISGIDLPSLSYVAVGIISSAAASNARAHTQTRVRFGRGAFTPPKSVVGTGYREPVPSGPANAAMGPNSPISHVLSAPVRNQGLRGTCVAHAVVACVEWRVSFHPLSEQFKYWAAKTYGDDPFPEQEGTWVRCAKNSLASHGVCENSLWRYNPQPIPGNETQAGPGVPSAPALQDALLRTQRNVNYNDTSRQMSGKTAVLAQELNNGPVAISLPVFVDLITNEDNWSWTGAYDYGHVIDPIPLSVASEAGHAICVCEYMSFGSAPGGGWFIFKNSWGVNYWSTGNNTPPVGHPRCQAGYGYLSAAYVDKYLSELLRVV